MPNLVDLQYWVAGRSLAMFSGFFARDGLVAEWEPQSGWLTAILLNLYWGYIKGGKSLIFELIYHGCILMTF